MSGEHVDPSLTQPQAPPKAKGNGRTEPQQRDVVAAEIARLAALPQIDFVLQYKDAAKSLGLTVAEIKQLIKDARGLKKRDGKGSSATNAKDASPLPEYQDIRGVIRVFEGLRHKAADRGLQALQAAGVGFYQRSQRLVRVCRGKAKTWDGAPILVPSIMPVERAILGRELGRATNWETQRGPRIVPIDPPPDVVAQIMDMVDEWPFPPLAGIIACPTLRPDGSILTTEGYDPATGLVLHSDVILPPMPENPSYDDAIRARNLLLGLLVEFPFTNEASMGTAMSMLMTPVVRGSMSLAPLHTVNAPQPGSGKSYLTDCSSVIATGERCAVIAIAPKAEETEKRLIGAALEGRPIIVLDNCRGLLQGDFLCQVTERPILQLRRLGSSDQFRIPNTFSMFANGNNLTAADDMVRRTISSDARC